MGAGRPTKRRRYASPKPEPKPSPFLKIPLELRLQIYDYALSDVTITVAEQERNMFDSTVQLEGEIEGLPPRYVPLVSNEYEPNMVMCRQPTLLPYRSSLDPPGGLERYNSANTSLVGVSMDSGYASAGSSMYSIASTSTTSLPLSGLDEKLSTVQPVTNVSLLHVNKQIRNEVLLHMRSQTSKKTTLYVTYPFGLLVLRRHYPALLKNAKHVVITGSYTSPDPASPSASSPSPPPDPTQLAATKALQSLTRTLYSSYRRIAPETYFKALPTLHMRIFYPDERRYSSVWGDDQSPVVAAMPFIPAGDIEAKTWRGRLGNGVTLKVRPPQLKNDTRGVRTFISVFRRFKGQRRQCCRREARKIEEFWEESFADAERFEKEVPEERCWNKT